MCVLFPSLQQGIGSSPPHGASCYSQFQLYEFWGQFFLVAWQRTAMSPDHLQNLVSQHHLSRSMCYDVADDCGRLRPLTRYLTFPQTPSSVTRHSQSTSAGLRILQRYSLGDVDRMT